MINKDGCLLIELEGFIAHVSEGGLEIARLSYDGNEECYIFLTPKNLSKLLSGLFKFAVEMLEWKSQE